MKVYFDLTRDYRGAARLYDIPHIDTRVWGKVNTDLREEVRSAMRAISDGLIHIWKLL